MGSNRIDVIPVGYAKSTISEDGVFFGGDPTKRVPIVFMVYLIRTGERNILVDAGCVTMPGWDMKNYIGPIGALENIGFSTSDITDVIITHAHHDHIECVSEFKNADIYIQKDEYNDGKKYFADGMKLHLFDEECEVCKGVKAVKIAGHSVGSCVVEISDGVSEKTTVIAGDEIYGRICLEQNIRTGSSVSPENSEKFLAKYNNDRYEILLCHQR